MRKLDPLKPRRHDLAEESSANLCDRLFQSLAERVDSLQRAKSAGCCGLNPEGGAKFAYVYHNLKGAKLDIWFIGEESQINQYPELNIRPRSDTKSGWKKFNYRFSIENNSQIQVASDLLASTMDVPKLLSPLVGERRFFPDEVEASEAVTSLPEGALREVLVNAYERNEEARRLCIQNYGAKCFICEFDFSRAYGEYMSGFIHVHHLKPIAEIRKQYIVDPRADLRPVCPNCHAVIHHRDPPLAIQEVKSLLERSRDCKKG